MKTKYILQSDGKPVGDLLLEFASAEVLEKAILRFLFYNTKYLWDLKVHECKIYVVI